MAGRYRKGSPPKKRSTECRDKREEGDEQDQYESVSARLRRVREREREEGHKGIGRRKCMREEDNIKLKQNKSKET